MSGMVSTAGLALPGLINPLMPTMGMLGPAGMPGPGITNPMFPTLGGMAPGLTDSRPPPLGRMSPNPRDRSNRSFSSRSPSPEYGDRYGRDLRRYPRGERDHSPGSRSERRQSPVRRGPSPTRSERGSRGGEGRESYDTRYEAGYRGDRDRFYNGASREVSPDRFSSRSERSDRGSSSRAREQGGRYNQQDRQERTPHHNTRADYLKEPTSGPKTSSPLEPQQVRNYGP